MPIGNYEVKAEHQGFSSQLRSGIELTVGRVAVVDFELPPVGRYAVGFAFLPVDDGLREKAQDMIESIVVDCGLTVLGWRGGPGGRVCATTLHGVFDEDGFRVALLDGVAGGGGRPRASFAAARAARFDRIADTLEAHVDLDRLFGLMGLRMGIRR